MKLLRNKNRLRSSVLLVATLLITSLFVLLGANARAQTYSMWSTTTTPGTPSENDSAAVEVGVKFRSSTNGQVTGIRFYKGAGNTGTHVGNLWSKAGTKLATVTFTGETASGWQQASFAAPVTITANTTYVASYFAPKGHYADDVNYFATSASTSGPLTFLKNGTDGVNGVYKYAAKSAFPNSGYSSSNYWVDVIYSDSTGTTDTTPPTVGSVTPVSSATNVATNSVVTATFSEALAPATVTATSATLVAVGGSSVTATVAYNSSNNQVTMTPSAALASGTTYTATLTTAITDVAGNHLAANYSWSFTTAAAADTTPPTVSSVTPTTAATGVATNTTVSAVFSEALASSTVTTGSFTLQDGSGTAVSSAVSYNSGANTAILTPTAALANGSTYTATLTTAITDVAGNHLAANYSWSFTTAAGSTTPVDPLAQGHGGPILIVTSAASPTNNYYAEILRAEGLNSFSTIDSNDVTATVLAQYDVVLLGSVPLTSAQTSLFTAWVNGGGNLVAMRPDKQLSSLLGLTDQNSTLADAYLKIDTSQAPGAGITADTMQFHGTADNYAVTSGTQTVAALYSGDTIATTNPAVTLRSVGSNGGHAAAFTYDLATSEVRTHQGNPAWSGTNRDTDATIRPDDLFYGGSSADYLNLSKVSIPQADEQQRLLTNLITTMNQAKKPLAKFWYLPNGVKAAVLMVGDDHGGSGAAGVFDSEIAASAAGCSAVDWQCVRSTSLMYTNTSITPSQATAYDNQGFELGIHVNPANEVGTSSDSGCGSWLPGDTAWLGSQFDSQLASWRSLFPNLSAQVTTRNHCAIWSDYATSAKVEAARGLRVDLNYYYWPGTWVQNRPGFFNGSGLGMRYADTNGSLIDVYQVPSDLVNETNMVWPDAIGQLLDKAVGSQGYYGIFGTHYDYRGDGFDTMLVQQAQARGVPLVSGKMVASWLDARNNSYYGNEAWNGNAYTFSATVDANARSMMRGMVPYTTAKGTLVSLSKDGTTLSYTLQTIKGVTYAFFTATTGSYVATYAADTTPPTVTGITPANGATNVATTSSVTATFSEALDASSVTSSSVELLDANSTPVAATVSYDANTNTATLKPTTTLTTSAQYTVRIHGADLTNPVKDLAGNALAVTYTSSFTSAAVTQTSLWAPTVPSYTVATNDTANVELGIRFTSNQSGKISAITFYKGTNDASVHTVTLWDAAGTALATATTTSETATGWQTATFATPVAIAAGTVYTASYDAPAGQYPYTYNTLNTAYTNGALTAQANGGVYKYGGGYPTGTYNGSSYWVDVVFTP